MRVLVTGASGFAGGPVCAGLLAAGHAVRGLLRPGTETGGVPEAVEVVQGDVTVPASLSAAVAGVDAVVHLAATKQAARSRTYQRINAEGTAHVAAAAREAGVTRFVLLSSIAAQGPSPRGMPHHVPGSEAPLHEYGRSKLAAERRLLEHFPIGGTILRPSLLYGPGDTHLLAWARMVQARVVPVVPDLEVSFLHVRDLAAIIVAVLAHAEPPRGPFFVSDGALVTMGAVIDQLERLVGGEPALRLPLPTALLARWAGAIERFARLTGLGTMAGRRLAELSASGWACRNDAAVEAFDLPAPIPLAAGLAETVSALREAGRLLG